MPKNLSRREFLKLSALGLASLAFRPLRQSSIPFSDSVSTTHQNEDFPLGGDIARVAAYSVSVYSQPWDKSKILYQRYQDDLVNLYESVQSSYGPETNPTWYRVWRGYIHSAHLQCVRTKLNPVVNEIPDKGMLTEVSVPISLSMRYTSYDGWTPLYRLYYQSTHWVRKVDEGPDGQPWYLIEDELDSSYKYWTPAANLRPIPESELTPLSPDVPPQDKRIYVSIERQELTAYEGDKVVMQTKISSGLHYQPEGELRWDTPTGTYNIYSKMPSKHMGDGHMRSDYLAEDFYELPGVPWVCFFEESGVATHGTYWHDNFGNRMSHGCINMRNEEAKWIYRWTTPPAETSSWETRGRGTKITVA